VRYGHSPSLRISAQVSRDRHVMCNSGSVPQLTLHSLSLLSLAQRTWRPSSGEIIHPVRGRDREPFAQPHDCVFYGLLGPLNRVYDAQYCTLHLTHRSWCDTRFTTRTGCVALRMRFTGSGANTTRQRTPIRLGP